MLKLVLLTFLLCFWTMMIPASFVTGGVLIISTFYPPEFLLGSAFLEFLGGAACAAVGFEAIRRTTLVYKFWNKVLLEAVGG